MGEKGWMSAKQPIFIGLDDLVLREGAGGDFDFLCGNGIGVDQDAVAEFQGLPGGQNHRLVEENCRAEETHRLAVMHIPWRRVTRVGGMIDDSDAACGSGEIQPSQGLAVAGGGTMHPLARADGPSVSLKRQPQRKTRIATEGLAVFLVCQRRAPEK